MTGVLEMFQELSDSERDWFQLQFSFEREADARREQHRESQRMIDWRKRGGPPGKRGRPSLGLTVEQMRERKRQQNHQAYLERKARAA